MNFKSIPSEFEYLSWPEIKNIEGFEMHYGESNLIKNQDIDVKPLFEDQSLGWIIEKKDNSFIGGTYLHGIFDNGKWRRSWLNVIRIKKGLKKRKMS